MEDNKTYNLPAENKRQLPSLEDLHHDIELAGKQDTLNELLSNPPPDKWLKVHPYVNVEVTRPDGVKTKTGLKYLPVEKVKYLLINIFQGYQWEIKSVQQLFNSVVVTGTLTVINPITGKEMKNDGVAAVGVQTDAGATAADMAKIKTDAVMKAAPAAESYALKNAAEKFGEIFGGNVMKNHIPFVARYANDIDVEELQELLELKREALDEQTIADAERIINSQERVSYPKLHKKLQSA